MTFNRQSFETALGLLADHYETSAPTVAEWADQLYRAKDHEVTLADIHLVSTLADELPPANYAANQVYHLQTRLGRETVGQAGF